MDARALRKDRSYKEDLLLVLLLTMISMNGVAFGREVVCVVTPCEGENIVPERRFEDPHPTHRMVRRIGWLFIMWRRIWVEFGRSRSLQAALATSRS